MSGFTTNIRSIKLGFVSRNLSFMSTAFQSNCKLPEQNVVIVILSVYNKTAFILKVTRHQICALSNDTTLHYFVDCLYQLNILFVSHLEISE